MTFRFAERPKSRQTSSRDLREQRVYFAAGSANEEYVRSMAILSTPQAIATAVGMLFRQDVTLTPEGADHWEVTVDYGPRGTAPIVGNYRLGFDTTGGTIHIKTSKETIEAYPIPTPPLAGPPDFKQAIGVHGDQVDGVDVVIPALKLNVSYRHPQGIISLAQIKKLARNTARVNSDRWLTFEPGEVLFLGAQGTEGTDAETEVTYHFACSENATGLTIGNITGIAKDGHEVVWIKFKDSVDTNRPVIVPEFAYVERVYELCSFASLFGFGS